ncbi:putative peroxygenase 3 [Iris pallida]|uniref:Peroxygenase 3 n=1 Tax=Iris pallida TaxID=29817 RepID=A0AAX6DHH0_IRIPA|nr:putative peroxygenase 3 [Iris pallida]
MYIVISHEWLSLLDSLSKSKRTYKLEKNLKSFYNMDQVVVSFGSFFCLSVLMLWPQTGLLTFRICFINQ